MIRCAELRLRHEGSVCEVYPDDPLSSVVETGGGQVRTLFFFRSCGQTAVAARSAFSLRTAGKVACGSGSVGKVSGVLLSYFCQQGLLVCVCVCVSCASSDLSFIFFRCTLYRLVLLCAIRNPNLLLISGISFGGSAVHHGSYTVLHRCLCRSFGQVFDT